MAVESTMMPMTLSEIAETVGGGLVIPEGVAATPQTVATSAVTDSREVGEAGVFVAIAGERVDGHDFVGRAAQSGAAVALVAHQVDAPMAQIVVPDTVAALGALAQHNIERRRALDTPFTIVGITGSVGKTTTKDMLAALLGSMGETVAPVGSFNNEIGLPLTALKVGPDTRYLVAEMGANHVGEIARLTTIAPPDIAVVLKVGVAHLGEFGSVEEESLLDAVTALSGSGPAYIYLFLRALIAAGEEQGLSAQQAQTLALQTMEGGLKMARTSGKSLDELIAAVSSKGGTTVAALESFEKDGFERSVLHAVDAAARRAGELSR